MTGIHFLGCKCCGTYDRHNEVAQVAFAWFKYEMKFSGSTGSFDSLSKFVGISAKGKGKHTDGQVWGSPLCPKRVAFDVSIVNQTAVSHSGAGARMWRVLFSTRMQGPDLQRRRKLTRTSSYASSVVWTLYR